MNCSLFLFYSFVALSLVVVTNQVSQETLQQEWESTVTVKCLKHQIWVSGWMRRVSEGVCECVCFLCHPLLASQTMDVRVKDTFTFQACLVSKFSPPLFFCFTFALSIFLPVSFPPLGAPVSVTLCIVGWNVYPYWQALVISPPLAMLRSCLASSPPPRLSLLWTC